MHPEPTAPPPPPPTSPSRPPAHRSDRARTVPVVAAELLTWLAVAAAGLLMLTQGAGWNGNQYVATVQSLTPYTTAALVPIAGIAAWRGRHSITAAASAIGLAGLLLASPLIFPPSQPEPVENAAGLRVASVNLFYGNPSVEAVADELVGIEAAVIVFNEFTAEHRDVLHDHPFAADFPHRIERDGLFAGGIAIWSRYPLVEGERPATVNYSLDTVVAGPDGDVRLLGVHPPTPVFNFDGWIRDLDLIGDIGSAPGEPILIIGDFNASYWHPPFRDLLRRGFVDAHMAAGKGFSTSWPTDQWVPPFVRLDHALTGSGLVSVAVDDFPVPGSDHRGFVVTVVPARGARL